jgi:hypothetical protein
MDKIDPLLIDLDLARTSGTELSRPPVLILDSKALWRLFEQMLETLEA